VQLDALEVAAALLGVALAVAVWLALVLATFGVFFGAAAALAALAAGAAAALLLGLRLRRAAPLARPRPFELAGGVGLVLLGAAVLGRPHEFVLGGLDPGVYVNAAVMIADRGGLIWRDQALAALPAEARLALFREPPGPFVQGSRLIGFYIVDLAAGRVVPHGLHLFPSALALGQALGGLGLALAVPSLLAGLGVAAVALLARRLAGGPAGLLAGLLLLLNPAETWFGRYPAAEMAAQAFFFAGLLALALALTARSTPLALLAGAMVGLVHLAKVELFVLPLAVGALFGWLWLTGRLDRLHGLFLLGYGAILLHALLHAGLIATEYTVAVYGRNLPPPRLLLLVAALAVGLAGAALWRRRTLRRLAHSAEARSSALWRLLAAAAVLLLGYGWLLRPLDPWGELASAPEPLRLVVRNRLEALPRLGWYLPTPALLAATAGFLYAARRRPSPPLALLLVVLALDGLVTLSDARIYPEYPWAARRWVGLLIPGAILLAAAAVGWLAAAAAHDRARRVAAGGLAAGLGAAMLVLSALASAPLLAHREYAGSTALVNRIAAGVEPDGVVMLDDDLVGWLFSAPLQFIARRSAFVAFGEAGRDERAAAALDAWRALGRPLYWLRVGEPAPFDRWGRRWTPLRSWPTDLPEVVRTTDRPPRDVRLFAVPITLYRAAEPP
jgi:4-amino-4-deoxy-L-arabinose transferase-like glycosyltransferase